MTLQLMPLYMIARKNNIYKYNRQLITVWMGVIHRLLKPFVTGHCMENTYGFPIQVAM